MDILDFILDPIGSKIKKVVVCPLDPLTDRFLSGLQRRATKLGDPIWNCLSFNSPLKSLNEYPLFDELSFIIEPNKWSKMVRDHQWKPVVDGVREGLNKNVCFVVADEFLTDLDSIDATWIKPSDFPKDLDKLISCVLNDLPGFGGVLRNRDKLVNYTKEIQKESNRDVSTMIHWIDKSVISCVDKIGKVWNFDYEKCSGLYPIERESAFYWSWLKSLGYLVSAESERSKKEARELFLKAVDTAVKEGYRARGICSNVISAHSDLTYRIVNGDNHESWSRAKSALIESINVSPSKLWLFGFLLDKYVEELNSEAYLLGYVKIIGKFYGGML